MIGITGQKKNHGTLPGRQNRAQDEQLLELGVFQKILARERALAYRNHHWFSLMVFEGRDQVLTRGTSSERLMNVLHQRLRLTDIAGWMDTETVAVILSATSRSDALMLAGEVCQRVAHRGTDLHSTVYAFPEHDAEHSVAKTPVEDDRQLVLFSMDEPETTDTVSQAACQKNPGLGLMSRLLVPNQAAWKRLVDVIGASTALILLSPLMLLIALFIKLVDPGPLLFRQERVGFMGKTFYCLKFRSMRLGADIAPHKQHLKYLMESDRPLTKLDHHRDPRLIPLGAIFRASGLDELPQIINVLKGDMSLIGPRPCLPYEYAGYQPWHVQRLDTLPGLTGLWQVTGKNRTTFSEMMRLDINYAHSGSFGGDLSIMMRTVPALVRQVKDVISVNRGR